MAHLFSKLAQIFSLLALCVIGLLVAIVFLQADMKKIEESQSFGCGTVYSNPYTMERDTTNMSDTIRLGMQLFNNNCQQCHSLGSEKIVGPGLRGILERQTLEWIVPWVQNSQKVIASGDPYAVKIFNENDKAIMQSFKLTKEEIILIMKYIQGYSPAIYVSSVGETISCK